MNNPANHTPPGKRKWRRFLLGSIAILLLVIAMAPFLLASTPLRDYFFSAMVNDPRIEITSSEASFGYFSPLSVGNLDIRIEEGPSRIQFRRIQADKSWLAMILDRPRLGTFTFVQPAVDITTQPPPGNDPNDPRKKPDSPKAEPDPGSKPPSSEVVLPQLTAVVEDASVTVRQADAPDPVVNLDGINVTFHLQEIDGESALAIDPVTVFDRARLTPEICNEGLQLVAPFLARQVDAEGEFSFRLEKFQVLANPETENDPRNIEIRGVVVLHQASMQLKDSLASRLIRLTSELVGTEMPERLQVARDTGVKFHVRDGRVFHEGFAMILPQGESSVAIRTSGSVGMDQTLDVQIDIGLDEVTLGTSRLAQHLAKHPVRLALTGTIEEPQLELASADEWQAALHELLSGDNADNQAGELIERTREWLGELLKNQPERRERLFPGLGERLRARRDRRFRNRPQ
jgi:hypothetical protein